MRGDVHVRGELCQGHKMKTVLIVVGALAAIYGVAQLLQLFGVFGESSGIAGVGITAGAFAVSAICFQKAFRPTDHS